MLLKLSFVVLCSAILVNSHPSFQDDSKTMRHRMYSDDEMQATQEVVGINRDLVRDQEQIRNRRGHHERSEDFNEDRRKKVQSDEEQGGLRRQKLKIKYSTSSDEDSRKSSGESHEVQEVQRQYHETTGSGGRLVGNQIIQPRNYRRPIQPPADNQEIDEGMNKIYKDDVM